MNRYVVTPKVSLIDANALQNSICTGIGSPTAIAGFAHKVDRLLAEANAPWRILGAALVVHKFVADKGNPALTPTPLPGTDNFRKNTRSPAKAIDLFRVSGEVSFVFEVTATVDDDLIDDEDEIEALDIIDANATFSRFAGGTLMPEFFGKETERTSRVDARTALELLLKAGDGVVLFDETRYLADLRKIQPDALAALVSAIEFTPDEDNPEGPMSQNGPLGKNEKFVPIASGYALIETPKMRVTGRLDDAPHAYAEPMTSLGRYVPLENLLDRDDPFTGSIWRYTESSRNDIYPVSGY